MMSLTASHRRYTGSRTRRAYAALLAGGATLSVAAPSVRPLHAQSDRKPDITVSALNDQTVLGEGWNVQANKSTKTACVDFRAASNNALRRHVDVTRVDDEYTLAKRWNISGEAQLNAWGGSGSAKMAVVRNTKLQSTDANYALYAVATWSEFTTPLTVPGGSAGLINGEAAARALDALGQRAKADSLRDSLGIVRGRLSGIPRVGLSDSALKLLKNPPAFRQQCGTHYVDLIVKGAEIFGVMTLRNVTYTAYDSTNKHVEVHGAGGSFASVTGNKVIDEFRKQDRFAFSANILAGSGGTTPVTWDGLQKLTEAELAKLAQTPVHISYVLTPYEALPNWPSSDTLPSDSTRQREAFARTLGRISTLLNDVAPIAVAPSTVDFTGTSSAAVEMAADSLRDDFDALSLRADACYKSPATECAGIEIVEAREMRMRARLPLRHSEVPPRIRKLREDVVARNKRLADLRAEIAKPGQNSTIVNALQVDIGQNVADSTRLADERKEGELRDVARASFEKWVTLPWQRRCEQRREWRLPDAGCLSFSQINALWNTVHPGVAR